MDSGVYIQLPPKVQSLKKSLIGREEVPRLLRDNAFAFGSGAVHKAAGKNEHWGKKSRKDNRGGEGTRAGTQTAGGGGKTGISYSGVTRRIMR